MKPPKDLRKPSPRERAAPAEIDTGPKPKLAWSLVAIGAYCAAYLGWTALSPASAGTKSMVSDWIGPITALIGAIWSLRGVRVRSGQGRRGWAADFLSLGIAAYGVGEVLWAYYELARHEQPFPSWADAGYVASSLAIMTGILLLPSRPLPTALRARVLVDSLMVMAALVTFSWFFALGPAVQGAQETLLAKTLTVAYPIADLAMVFCLLVLSAHSHERRLRPVRNLVCVGVSACVVADVVFGYCSLHETYLSGQAVDVGWMFSNLTLGLSVATLRRYGRPSEGGAAPADVGRPPTLWRTLLPYALVPAVAALMVYVYRSKVDGSLALGVYVGSIVLVALILVRQVFAIVENAKLYRYLQAAYRELEAMATTDAMTGLPNHRVFQQRLRAEIGCAKEASTSVSLLLVDVDRFKSYNDNFGHPAGDEALRIVGRLLRENVRKSDLPARYGGEEFAVILPDTGLDMAAGVAERVRAACEAHEFPLRAVTLSVGVSTWGGGEAGTMIEEADRALYAAKHSGRNQVSIAGRTKEGLPLGWSLHAAPEVAKSDAALASPLMRTMLAMLSLRDHDVERHSDRVTRYCLRLAQEAVDRGVARLSNSEMADLHLGALLHDIGKVGTPDAILHKPSGLTEAEWKVVRRHPTEGESLLADVPHLAGAAPIVRSHHERWDGAGYPDRLAGEAIPLGARIFALADALDAMWSDRPYRAALGFREIRDEIRRMAGGQFDPALVEAFLGVPQREWEALKAEAAPMERAA